MFNIPKVLESIDDLHPHQLHGLLQHSQKIKNLNSLNSKEQLFSHASRTVTLTTFFAEPSTRTRLSFQKAAQNLRQQCLDIDALTSSVQKGEDLHQTFLTLAAMGVDICVFRSKQSHLLADFKENPPLNLINAGDGSNEHPTQALTDLLTLMSLTENLDGKTIGIIGDAKHSRVFHSLARLLPQFGINLLLVTPERFQLETQYKKHIQVLDTTDELINNSDFVYLLRIQKERHQSQKQAWDLSRYHQHYGVSLERLKFLNHFPPILHAGPANIGLEIGAKLIASQYYMGHQQVKHSIFLRMALLDLITKDLLDIP